MKGSIAAASAALIASVAAAHSGHAGFHLRRNAPVDDVCTVYTTVYVYPSEIPVPVANSTVVVYPTPVESPSSSAVKETPIHTPESPSEVYTPAPPPSSEAYPPAPPPPSSKEEAYTPAPPAPSSKEEAYTPAPPAPSSTEEAKPTKEIYSHAPPPPAYTPKPEQPSSKEVPKPAPSSSKVEAPKPKPSKPVEETPSYGGDHGGRIVTKGKKWAITYTPYTADGQCKSAGEVKTDIANIAEMGFTTIRSYSTDCGVFENVVPACQEHGLKVIYGIFLEAGGKGGKGPFSDYANGQLKEIISSAPKDSVALLIVGNESLFNNYCTAEELGSYIDYVKEQLHGAGFPKDIAVTTTEPVITWEEKGAALCSHIDVFACQVHPYFTSKVAASDAGEFAKEQLEKAAKVCPEVAAKGKYITEIGWPKSGEANGNAHPGYDEQKEAIKGIMETVGTEACLFSYQDDLWKAPGAFSVEQSFGCAEAIY